MSPLLVSITKICTTAKIVVDRLSWLCRRHRLDPDKAPTDAAAPPAAPTDAVAPVSDAPVATAPPADATKPPVDLFKPERSDIPVGDAAKPGDAGTKPADAAQPRRRCKSWSRCLRKRRQLHHRKSKQIIAQCKKAKVIIRSYLVCIRNGQMSTRWPKLTT